MATRLDLETRFNEQVQNDTLYGTTEVRFWLNEAMRQWVNSVGRNARRVNPTGNPGEVVAGMVTVIGQQEYFPNTHWTLTDFDRPIEIRVNNVICDYRSYHDILQMQSADLGTLVGSGGSTTVVRQQPLMYYIRDYTSNGPAIGFYPIPDQVYNVDMTYERVVADLTGDADTPLVRAGIPQRYHSDLLYYMLWKLLTKDHRFADAEYHRALWESRLTDAEMDLEGQPSTFRLNYF